MEKSHDPDDLFKGILLLRVAGICGIITPIFVISMILYAIQLASWFSWGRNALSDLGASEPTATIFNSSLIIGGIFAIIFAIGLLRLYLKSPLGLLSTSLIILSMIFLCSIGVFPETVGSIHFYVSVAFFVSISGSLLLLSSAMIQIHQVKEGLFTFAIGFITAITWGFPWKGVAIPEIIVSLAISIWSIRISLIMLGMKPER